MEKRIRTYRAWMDELLKREGGDWKKIREEHLVQVGFFQHERMIHLIVTITFALLTMLSLCALVIVGSVGGNPLSFLILVIALLVLLVPYVRHYYILENEVQKMYVQYDEICRWICKEEGSDETSVWNNEYGQTGGHA